jgi:hypothetical protein
MVVKRDGVTLTPGADPLEDFLFTWRQGHCEYFAASMAVLARAWKRLASGTPGALRELRGFVALGVAGLGLISLLLLRRKRGPARPQSPVVFYERMLRLLARRGFLRPAASTAREFARSLARHPAHGPVTEITGLYERVRFGQERLSQADERRALDLLDTLRSVTRQDRPKAVARAK